MPLAPVTVQVDKRQLAAVGRMLRGVRNGLPRAVTRGLNKVGRRARTKVVRALARATGIKQKNIRRYNLKLRLASYRRWLVLLAVFGKRIPVIALKARQRRRGVSYRFQRKRTTIAGAFIARMPPSKRTGRRHRGVYVRRGRARVPLAEQFEESVPAVMEQTPELARATLEAELAGKAETEIARQARLILEREALRR